MDDEKGGDGAVGNTVGWDTLDGSGVVDDEGVPDERDVDNGWLLAPE